MDIEQICPATELSYPQQNEPVVIQRLRIFLTDEDENDLQIEESPEEEIVQDVKKKRGRRRKLPEKIKTKRKRVGRKKNDSTDKIPDEWEPSHSSDEPTGSEETKERKKKERRSSFPCFHCHYSSSWKTNLEKHVMAQHTGERPFRCSHCDYSSVHQCLLEKHWNTYHLGVILNCTDCPFTSETVETYLKHVNSSHGGERMLSCEVCGRRAVSLSALEIHILEKHGSIRGETYPCPHCGYSAVLRENLASHLQILHECAECGFQSESTRELRRHKKKVHRARRSSKGVDH